MDPLLASIRNAVVDELARQATGAQGFRPPPAAQPDSVGYFDGDIRLMPLVLAVLRELRKLPDARMVKAIDTALAVSAAPAVEKGRR